MVSDNWEITVISPSISVSFIATSDMSNCAAAVFQLSSAATDEVERQQALQTKVTEHNSLWSTPDVTCTFLSFLQYGNHFLICLDSFSFCVYSLFSFDLHFFFFTPL